MRVANFWWRWKLLVHCLLVPSGLKLSEKLISAWIFQYLTHRLFESCGNAKAGGIEVSHVQVSKSITPKFKPIDTPFNRIQGEKTNFDAVLAVHTSSSFFCLFFQYLTVFGSYVYMSFISWLHIQVSQHLKALVSYFYFITRGRMHCIFI